MAKKALKRNWVNHIVGSKRYAKWIWKLSLCTHQDGFEAMAAAAAEDLLRAYEHTKAQEATLAHLLIDEFDKEIDLETVDGRWLQSLATNSSRCDQLETRQQGSGTN